MNQKTSNIHSVEIESLTFYTTRDQEFLCSAHVVIGLPSLTDPNLQGPELTLKVGLEANADMQIQAVERAILDRTADILRNLAATTGSQLQEIHKRTRADLARSRG